jgi:multidrug efflux pump subunit AcrA (membrane-fusion protein)
LATDTRLKQQELQQQGQIASMQAAAQAAANERDHQLRQAQLSITAEMEQQKLGMAQQQLQLQTQQAQQKVQAQQSYTSRVQQLMAGGMSADAAGEQAALEIGPSLIGESVSGLGSLKRADALTNWKPSEITMPSGTIMEMNAPGRATEARLPVEWTPDTAAGTQTSSTGKVEALPRGPGLTQDQKAIEIYRLNNEKDKLLQSKYIDPSVADALGAGTGIDPAWSDRQKKSYASFKKRLDDIDGQIKYYSPQQQDTNTATPAQFRYNPDTKQLEPVKQSETDTGYGEGE